MPNGSRLTVLAAVLLLTGCGVARQVVRPAVNWDFIQAVGGVKIDTPYIDQDILYIPVTVDFSGNKRITVRPSLPNTGLQCDWGNAQLRSEGPFPFIVFDYDIELQFYAVETTVPRLRPFTAAGTDSCEKLLVPLALPTRIGVLPEPESIHLWYRDSLFVRHYLGEFVL